MLESFFPENLHLDPPTIRHKRVIKKKNHDKIVLIAKSKLNSIEFKVLIDLNIGHDEFV